MTSDDELGDWRLDAVTRLAQDVPPAYAGGPSHKVGDRLWLTTVTKTSKGDLIGFPTPNTSALALNIAQNAARRANALRTQFSYEECPSPWGTSKDIADQDELLFEFFENCMVCMRFSFHAVEAFCNYSISRIWRHTVEIKRKKERKTLPPEEAERLSTEDKLKSVLPKIYDVPTPAGKAVWEGFVRLMRVRDSTVHIKYRDQYPSSEQSIKKASFSSF